jgi:protocatechuate 3,4-dioxygenase alpha subunit
VSRPAWTPSQTVGPFFHDALLRPDAVAVAPATGPCVRIVGTVRDGAGAGVPDAVLEAWQGRDFRRVATGEGGHFTFTMTHPSAVSGERTEAPHVEVVLFARGLLNQLVTRIYFPDTTGHETDPVLRRVPAERRSTLVARPEPGTDGPGPAFRFDIVLQGADETVFLDIR